MSSWCSMHHSKCFHNLLLQSVVGHTKSEANDLTEQIKEMKIELAKRPKVDESSYEDRKTDLASKTDEIRTNLARKTDEIRTDLARKTDDIRTYLARKSDEIGNLACATEDLRKEFAGEVRNLKADLARTNQLMEEILKKMA